MKKPSCPRRSVRKIDEYVIDYACEDACVKVANVKLVKKIIVRQGKGAGRRRLPSAHKNTCVYQLIASGEGTSNNRLWSL